ncbi:LOW QUALITY PROTEIN: WD repeat-containing protein 97 [Zalophus californianus]|uniref:LOW QUALITY PROTEIN: WD repeat-containing protein 97 n=1 Tax=Zalophus californianus TaxID=9704 RepID=A0A6P9FAC5_ZALCA|nr:LOW QUALITY PROTEIN: WD repeat-containing protein 97 [Zalophus californianus]
METEDSDASNPYSVEGNKCLDPDVCDADSCDIPDPGLLKEKNEVLSEPVPRLFTSSSRWQNMTPRARAHQLWLFLRAGLHDFVEKEKRGERCVARLTHGLEPLRHLKVAAGLCSVAQDPVGRRFVVLDGAGHLHVHREDGWAYEKLQAPAVLTGLVAVPGPLDAVSRFVGWGPKGLAILRPDLSLLWLSKPGVGRVPGHEPLCCLPVPSLGLLLVAGAGGSLVLWKFCSGGRRLVPCGSPLQLPPSPTGTLTRLVLGPLQSHQVPRCFAAYGSAVLTFDLHTWALVDVRRDLHKTAILDLAYCLEVEAMVTASRDSTVKVWEADWRIRMVFMGHTGPVTALAVLPNTSLVLSASQDGTLRTWDLQAAAQVGEVALNCWGPDVASGRVNRLLAPAGPSWPVLSLRASSVELWRLRELYSPLAQLSAPVLHVQVVPALSAPPHPLLPARLVCACADGSVYLVSVATGRTVSALLLEPGDCAASVLYCLPREALWLLTRTGQLVCASAARCPMRVLHRVCPPPAPAPRPCCLHLYSHLTDPGSAFAGWETVCQHGGEPCRSDAARAWKDKNRYLPVVGHTDGTLSVLEWRWSKTVFQTEAHSPGPVTAIASTWNSIVSSGGDLTVKMWRVYPYAEESLSLLRTFSCGHPAVGLCALGKRITVGFEDPDSATYGLVQFGLGDSPRYDHRSQDDPTDHITGLCCCPTLKLYACSSLDCTVRIWTAENRLLRLLQLNGAPQGLTFSSNSGDLVLALGSRLCLVSHRLYLPTSYLVKKLCQKVPDVVDDPLLPLTSQESRTSAQLQRLGNLHGVASLSTDWSFAHRQTATPQQPVLEEDLEALVARDQDLQQLSLGLVVPTAQPPPSQHERQEAFDHYLHLIYGPGLLDVPSGREFQRWSTVTLAVERETWDVCTSHRAANCLWKARVCPEVPTVPAALPQRDPGAVGPRFVHPPRAPLPIPPVHRGVHSKASQLLARSSLSSNLGLSLDLQLHLERLRGEKPMVPGPPALHLQHGDPLLMKRRPKEPLSNLRGFFPTTIQPYKDLQRPVSFPGSVPNSVVLQQMWLHREVSSLGALAQHTSRRSKPGRRQDDLWLPRRIGVAHGQVAAEADRVVGGRGGGGGGGAAVCGLVLRYPEPTYAALRVRGDGGSERYGPLPRFCIFFVGQNWFKKLFPIFTLEAYPEVSTVEGLASLFVDLLYEASWADGVHILKALLRLLPDTSRDLRNQLQGVLVRLLNLDQPPSLEDQTQKQFVMLALQLLLAGSLQSREVVLELMSYFLYSPASRRPSSGNCWMGWGLQDPQGFLFKEMMTWVQGPDAGSKAALRKCCCQKLEEMIQRLQVLGGRGGVGCLQWSLLSCPHPAPPPRLAGALCLALYLCLMGPLLSPNPPFLGIILLLPRKESAARSQAWGPGQPLPWAWGHCPLAASSTDGALAAFRGQVVRDAAQGLPDLGVSISSQGDPVADFSARWVTSCLKGTLSPFLGTLPCGLTRELNLAVLESGAKPMPSPTHLRRSKHALSEAPPHFCPSEVHAPSSAPAALLEESLPLAQTDWSRSQMLDLGPIDALNFFCEQQRARLEQGFPQEELETLRPSPRPPESNTVLPQPRDRWHYPILRLQEAKVQRSPMRLRGWMRSRLWVGHTLSGSIRMLKLPLPRVEVQPFPPDWPRPARPLPPRLLQPTLQRYFLPDYTETLTATADQTGGPSLFFPPAWSQDVALQPAVLPWK